MADEGRLRSAGKSIAEAMISPDQLPLKKRNQNLVSEFKIPDLPNSSPEIDENETAEIDAYEKRSEEASGSSQQQPVVWKVTDEAPWVDIYEFLDHLEIEATTGKIADYIERGIQKEFTIDMRSIFVDWLVKIAEKCKLQSDLVHLTISCIDRYLMVNAVDRKRLQPLGVASVLISLKYDYKGHPCAHDLCNTTGCKCTALEVVKMESQILKSLEFKIGNPTINTFLRKFTRVAREESENYNLQLEFLCDYLAELSLLEYKCIKFLPSAVAASVVFLSRFTIRSHLRPWSSVLQQESGYEPENLKECVLLIHDWKISRKGGGILNAVRNKYNQLEFKCVSELPCPATIPAIFFDDTTSMTDVEVSVRMAQQRDADARISQLHRIKLLSVLEGLEPQILERPEPQILERPEPQISMSERHAKAAKKKPWFDIFEHLRQLERDARRRPRPDYVENVQKDFTIDTRPKFVDWVLKVAEKCEFRSDLTHLTISNIDRYLSMIAVDMMELQILGLSSMLISLKYEYKGHPPAKDFCVTTGTKFTALEVVKMEYKMLKFLEFEIGIPTISIFVRKFVIAAQEEDEMYDLLLEFMADYLAELSLFEYKCLKFLPSMVAAAVVFLSRCTIVSDSPPWSTPMEEETGYDAPSLKECVILIYDLQMNKKGGGFLEAVRNKYNQDEYKCVSAFEPPEEIPDYYFDEFEEEDS